MAIGFSTDKAAMDNRAATIAQTIRNTLIEAQRMKDWLDTQTDTDLTDRGWTPGEVAILKSAYTDLAALGGIASGAQAGQATANNYLFWATKLLGPQ